MTKNLLMEFRLATATYIVACMHPCFVVRYDMQLHAVPVEAVGSVIENAYWFNL